jgi:PAS domain S-box-containing protein
VNWVVLFDAVGCAAFLGALLLVPRIPERVLDRQARLFLSICLGIYVFNGLSNVLQHGGITDFLDRFEDYLEILFAPSLLFFLFSALAGWERRRLLHTEQSLGRSEARFRELAELLPEIVFETDGGGRLTFVNRRGLELTGYGDASLPSGFPVLSLLAPDDRERARRDIAGVLAGAESRGVEYTIRSKDGAGFPALAFAGPIVRDGEAVGMRGLIVDASHAKALEAQLLQAQKMEAVGTLAGGVAHDFNNLIHAISGYLQLVLQGSSVTLEDRRRLGRAEQACARAAELVRGLLTFSRRSEPALSTVDLNREVTQVLSILERTIPKMIRIVPVLGEGLWPVRGDPVQVEQVLLNLGSNARDAIRGQGRLTIATANVEPGADHPRVSPDLPPGRYVRLTVSDDGEGMPPEVVEQVFDPFFTTKEVGRGTGLGLAVVYGIVRGHGGQVTCSSTPGRGTSFEIYLPAAPAAPGGQEVPATAAPARGAGRKLLVVDDDAVREIACEGLTGAGYRVQAVPSGEQALEWLGQSPPPALVVLDLGMPGMGGRSCLKQIRARHPGLPVLVASGYADDLHDPELCANATLAKPYRLAELLAAVGGVLGD